MNGQTSRRADGQRATFRQQVLWKKAQEFASRAAEVLDGLPGGPAAGVIGNQFLRSVTSIPANIAEGYGRYSQAAYRNHLSIVRGSAFESESWLDLMLRRRLISQEAFDDLLAKCDEIESLLTLRMKSLSEGKSYAVSEEQETYEL